jgi:long-subunit fatty acid transport protein
MNMTWAYAYQPTPKTHYEADFTWSHWATNKSLRLTTGPTGSVFDDGILSALTTTSNNDKDWNDAYGIQIGASHKLTNKLTLRGGSFFYFTPVPQKHFSPSVPDSNHLAITLGLGYDINKYLTADLSYFNAFYFSRRINNDVGENPALLNSSVDGRYYSYMQAFTISLTAHWDDLFPRMGAKKDEAPSIEMKPKT